MYPASPGASYGTSERCNSTGRRSNRRCGRSKSTARPRCSRDSPTSGFPNPAVASLDLVQRGRMHMTCRREMAGPDLSVDSSSDRCNTSRDPISFPLLHQNRDWETTLTRQFRWRNHRKIRPAASYRRRRSCREHRLLRRDTSIHSQKDREDSRASFCRPTIRSVRDQGPALFQSKVRSPAPNRSIDCHG